jgi:DNA (cytosine-5)-methyltransferase 1
MKIGSLFTGYGGLDMALAGELAWYSEINAAACRVLEAHHRDIPNLRDVTSIDWADVAPVDVLTAGYPCQPFSQAGKRQGSNDERHLWPYVATAIDAIRPGIVVLENVRGHLTLGFGDVLADLSRLGYDARWGVVRASDAGAPHHRARIFIIANTSGERYGSGQGPWLAGRLGGSSEISRRASSTLWQESGTGSIADAANSSGRRRAIRSRDRYAGRHKLVSSDSTLVSDTNSAGSEAWQHTRHNSESLWIEPVGSSTHTAWGQYEAAIRRWERILNRPAPEPTITTSNGRPRLSPTFVEWMMGLPEGWVTGHGLSSSQCLKMLGNGVVPQQAALALRLLTRSL